MRTSIFNVELKCDQCGIVTQVPGAVGWLQLQRHPDCLDTITQDDMLRDGRGPWDFCSNDCLWRWTDSHE